MMEYRITTGRDVDNGSGVEPKPPEGHGWELVSHEARVVDDDGYWVAWSAAWRRLGVEAPRVETKDPKPELPDDCDWWQTGPCQLSCAGPEHTRVVCPDGKVRVYGPRKPPPEVVARAHWLYRHREIPAAGPWKAVKDEEPKKDARWYLVRSPAGKSVAQYIPTSDMPDLWTTMRGYIRGVTHFAELGDAP